MEGKICLVTGASSGIGKATALKLAALGATVAVVSRSREKGQSALEEIRTKTGSTSLELFVSDFGSFESVRSLGKDFTAQNRSLHVLVNNAGVVHLRRKVTADGFEDTFQVNYLSHFLLTNLLVGLLKRSSPSRVINVSSAAHYRGHLDFGNLQLEKHYGVMRAYSQSKLALVLFTYELAKRLEGTGVSVNSVHPGAVATGMWGSQFGPARPIARVFAPFMLSPDEGAETSVFLAASSDVDGVTGKYFEKKQEKRSSAESYDSAVSARLWEESERMVRLRGAVLS